MSCDHFNMKEAGGKFCFNNGLRGKDGVTFYPHVSAEGIISWTNDGGKPNPDPVNIKGTDGKSAYEAAVEAGFSGTESEFNEYLSNIGVLTDEVTDQKSAIDDLTALVDRKAGALIDTASGAIASFTPDATIDNLLGVFVAVEPVQAGSGDPSPDNVRPISGWSEVGIESRGQNLIDDSKRFVQSSDVVYVGATSNQSVIPLVAGTYTVSVDTSGEAYGMYYREANGAGNIGLWAPGSGTTQKTFTLTETGLYRFWFYRAPSAGGVDTDKILWVQVELGSTATEYKPFTGNTYAIALGQTVYGGTLDAANGTMTVDRAMVDLGTLNWIKYDTAQGTLFRSGVVADAANVFNSTDFICSNYATVQSSSRSNGTISCAVAKSFDIIDNAYTDAATFKTAMSGVQLVYELATPIEITLTPTQIATISGQTNNVWSDAGDVDVEFAADLKHYIDSKIAAAVAALS